MQSGKYSKVRLFVCSWLVSSTVDETSSWQTLSVHSDIYSNDKYLLEEPSSLGYVSEQEKGHENTRANNRPN